MGTELHRPLTSNLPQRKERVILQQSLFLDTVPSMTWLSNGAIAYHVMWCMRLTLGTWLNDQRQLNQVMDLIKVLYEPLAVLPAAPDPVCTVLYKMLSIVWHSKGLFDLMLFHMENLDSVALHARNASIEMSGKLNRMTQGSSLATLILFKCNICLKLRCFHGMRWKHCVFQC